MADGESSSIPIHKDGSLSATVRDDPSSGRPIHRMGPIDGHNPLQIPFDADFSTIATPPSILQLGPQNMPVSSGLVSVDAGLNIRQASVLGIVAANTPSNVQSRRFGNATSWNNDGVPRYQLLGLSPQDIASSNAAFSRWASSTLSATTQSSGNHPQVVNTRTSSTPMATTDAETELDTSSKNPVAPGFDRNINYNSPSSGLDIPHIPFSSNSPFEHRDNSLPKSQVSNGAMLRLTRKTECSPSLKHNPTKTFQRQSEDSPIPDPSILASFSVVSGARALNRFTSGGSGTSKSLASVPFTQSKNPWSPNTTPHGVISRNQAESSDFPSNATGNGLANHQVYPRDGQSYVHPGVKKLKADGINEQIMRKPSPPTSEIRSPEPDFIEINGKLFRRPRNVSYSHALSTKQVSLKGNPNFPVAQNWARNIVSAINQNAESDRTTSTSSRLNKVVMPQVFQSPYTADSGLEPKSGTSMSQDKELQNSTFTEVSTETSTGPGYLGPYLSQSSSSSATEKNLSTEASVLRDFDPNDSWLGDLRDLQQEFISQKRKAPAEFSEVASKSVKTLPTNPSTRLDDRSSGGHQVVNQNLSMNSNSAILQTNLSSAQNTYPELPIQDSDLFKGFSIMKNASSDVTEIRRVKLVPENARSDTVMPSNGIKISTTAVPSNPLSFGASSNIPRGPRSAPPSSFPSSRRLQGTTNKTKVGSRTTNNDPINVNPSIPIPRPQPTSLPIDSNIPRNQQMDLNRKVLSRNIINKPGNNVAAQKMTAKQASHPLRFLEQALKEQTERQCSIDCRVQTYLPRSSNWVAIKSDAEFERTYSKTLDELTRGVPQPLEICFGGFATYDALRLMKKDEVRAQCGSNAEVRALNKAQEKQYARKGKLEASNQADPFHNHDKHEQILVGRHDDFVTLPWDDDVPPPRKRKRTGMWSMATPTVDDLALNFTSITGAKNLMLHAVADLKTEINVWKNFETHNDVRDTSKDATNLKEIQRKVNHKKKREQDAPKIATAVYGKGKLKPGDNYSARCRATTRHYGVAADISD